MPNTSTGQERKDRSDPKSYDEPVTVRHKIGTKFLNPGEQVPAFRGAIQEKVVFFTRPQTDMPSNKIPNPPSTDTVSVRIPTIVVNPGGG
ncbi:unnamed protein product [Gemmata massiliana]|uniref:Uncharacterized protein n=1 Tax=Gemmata massiliana TaxID=1210884 RepID=A0A6P2D551_9BACT|nr:hypothetical protein [Gemmata massiliana]VTR95214.1 unnamed protein product [Gemmata massiliana]